MEKNINNRDFEQFVQKNADQYRMFPSERVWTGIHKSIHSRRKWYGAGLALLLFTASTVTLVMLNTTGKKSTIATTLNLPQKEQTTTTEKVSQNIAIVAPVKPIANTNSSGNNLMGNLKNNNLFLSDLAIERINNNIPSVTPVVITNNTDETELTASQPPVKSNVVSARNKAITSLIAEKIQIVQVEPKQSAIQVINRTTAEPEPVSEKNVIASASHNLSPYTIESVLNTYKYVRKPKKLSWQIFVTPTVSYRELKENKPFLNAARTGSANTSNSVFTYTPDINSIVTHKPDIGFQIGFSAGYPLTRDLKITTGLQFNVSKYDIKAYNAPSEVATIALNTSSGVNNSVSTYTNYRNIGGYKADWLRNLYFSASVPVGLELKLTGNKKSYIGVGASVQPTYVLGNRAYLISTDYKNYAEFPSLTRKWNINTGFEMFAMTTIGNVKWRIGPQVRYQAMSSFVEKYPIKEHLFDFGLKLGIMLK
ncbi:MAG: hypothetical protein WBC06_15200 [Chitinophagaceae bacterium]